MNTLDNDHLNKCSGVALYHAIKEHHEEHGIAGANDAKTYAKWIKEAIRRGIADSIYASASEVHYYLASLYQIAGDTKSESATLLAAEASLDGFRLVDRVEDRVRSSVEKMDATTASKLIADLERAKRTKRLLEYPNYIGRLFRMKGELLEILGDAPAAINAYKEALEANPKAGCAKRLKLLSNGLVTPAAKPEPLPVEDRIHFANLSMFHFRCPLCGSTPNELTMKAYINSWNAPFEKRLKDILQLSSVVASTISPTKVFKSKKFDLASQAFASAVEKNFGRANFNKPFLCLKGQGLWMQKDCPVCKQSAGARQPDNYFTDWAGCCRVQGSNLFFEVGLICLALNQVPACWTNHEQCQTSKGIASLAFRICEAVGLSSCPRCGRFSGAIYGGSRTDPEKGMCRWCLDFTGASQITIRLESEQDG